MPKKTGALVFNEFYNGARYTDSTGREKTVYPGGPVKSFGFVAEEDRYDFNTVVCSGASGENNPMGYVYGLRVIDGYLKLYHVIYSVNYGYRTITVNVGGGLSSPRQTISGHNGFAFLKDGQLTIIPNGFNKVWLKNYFIDYRELSDKIGKQLKPHALEEMTRQYNAWHAAAHPNP